MTECRLISWQTNTKWPLLFFRSVLRNDNVYVKKLSDRQSTRRFIVCCCVTHEKMSLSNRFLLTLGLFRLISASNIREVDCFSSLVLLWVELIDREYHQSVWKVVCVRSDSIRHVYETKTHFMIGCRLMKATDVINANWVKIRDWNVLARKGDTSQQHSEWVRWSPLVNVYSIKLDLFIISMHT